jgi:hypothetical protein
MYWCSDEFDRLQAAGVRELDDAKRTPIYVRMQQLWDRAVNAVWIAWPTHYYAYEKGLDPAITPHGRILPHAFRSA